MSRKRVASISVVAILCFVFLSSAVQAKAPEEIFTVRDDVWVLSSGGAAQGQGGKLNEQEIWWYLVDPESDAAAKGLEPGILLCNAYTASGRLYSFVPLPEEQPQIKNISFSPDQKRMVVICRLTPFVTKLFVYRLDTLTLEQSFWGHGDIWWVDDEGSGSGVENSLSSRS